jgi:hypothetical protein
MDNKAGMGKYRRLLGDICNGQGGLFLRDWNLYLPFYEFTKIYNSSYA